MGEPIHDVAQGRERGQNRHQKGVLSVELLGVKDKHSLIVISLSNPHLVKSTPPPLQKLQTRSRNKKQEKNKPEFSLEALPKQSGL